MRVGSLCTGYGGLDLAVHAVLGGELKWLCEFDAAPAQVCEVRFPGVPNLHDLTAVEWEQVPFVDVLTAGYPCQPFSHAGRRKGTDDVRHLWPHIADAVRFLRPQLVVLENVAGHVSLGLDVVLGDLASLGFDAEWAVVRASDVGACHQRARLFIVATDTRSTGAGWNGRAVPRAASEGRRAGADVHAAVDAGQDAADADGGRLEIGCEHDGGAGEPRLTAPRRHDAYRLVPASANTDAAGSQGRLRGGEALTGPAGVGTSERCGSGAWGDYGPAIERHGFVVGRAAPRPTDARGRLSPRFVEWMMMLPDGWVTDVLTSRTKALKCLGNGVVPPQAAYAISGLLARLEAQEVAA